MTENQSPPPEALGVAESPFKHTEMVDPVKVTNYVRLLTDTFYLDDPTRESEEEQRKKRLILESVQQDPLQQKGFISAIDSALSNLQSTREPALRLRYALDDSTKRNLTFKEASRHMGVTANRVHQVVVRGLRELRRGTRNNPIYGLSWTGVG